LLHEQQDMSARLNEVREKLQSVDEKIQYTAMVRSQHVRGVGDKAEIAVSEKAKKARNGLSLAKKPELQPGDTVEFDCSCVIRISCDHELSSLRIYDLQVQGVELIRSIFAGEQQKQRG
jgi:hypothetical protein